MKRLAVSLLVLAAAGCSKDPRPATQTSAAQPVISAGENAAVGKPAPDFTLKDLDGKETRLSSFQGKIVVLEWFNPGCPFVNKSHTSGSLKDAPAKAIQNGVVWLAINSGAAGNQGAGVEANRQGAKKLSMSYPVLLDESGAVGHRYGATNTPHIFVIDRTGTLIYKGAVDNSPDGEGESPTDGKLVSYVDEAIAAATSGTTPATTETKAYGCGVKYVSH